MITLDQVRSNIADVAPEQIGKCHKVFDCQKGHNFYLVENSEGEFNDKGELIEYEVRYTREFGFTCNCHSGRRGWSNVKHPSGTCWHVRAAVACSIEEDMAMAELAKQEFMDRAFEAHIEEERKRLQPIEQSIPSWILDPSVFAKHRVGNAKRDSWID